MTEKKFKNKDLDTSLKKYKDSNKKSKLFKIRDKESRIDKDYIEEDDDAAD